MRNALRPARKGCVNRRTPHSSLRPAVCPPLAMHDTTAGSEAYLVQASGSGAPAGQAAAAAAHALHAPGHSPARGAAAGSLATQPHSRVQVLSLRALAASQVRPCCRRRWAGPAGVARACGQGGGRGVHTSAGVRTSAGLLEEKRGARCCATHRQLLPGCRADTAWPGPQWREPRGASSSVRMQQQQLRLALRLAHAQRAAWRGNVQGTAHDKEICLCALRNAMQLTFADAMAPVLSRIDRDGG